MSLFIKKLEVKNFKAHKDSTIEYGPLTIFIGRNDHGKTSIAYKALQVLLLNKGWSPSWYKFGETQATVAVELGAGSVKRTIDNGRQEVTVAAGKLTKTFDGISAAGIFIEKRFGIKKIQIDFRQGLIDFNFIGSKSPPFIVGVSDDVVQRQISGLFNLTNLEKARVTTNQMVGKLKDQEVILLQKYKEEDKRNKALDRKLKKISLLFNEAEELNQEVIDLQDQCSSMARYIQILEDIEVIDYTLNDLKDIALLEEEVEEIKDKVLQLSSLITTLENLESIDVSLEVLEECTVLEAAIESLNTEIVTLKSYLSDLENYQLTIDEIESVKKAMPKVCSECGRPL